MRVAHLEGVLCSGQYTFRRQTALVAVVALCALGIGLGEFGQAHAGKGKAQFRNRLRDARKRLGTSTLRMVRNSRTVQRVTKTAKGLNNKWKAGTQALKTARKNSGEAAHKAFSAIMGLGKKVGSPAKTSGKDTGGKAARKAKRNSRKKPATWAAALAKRKKRPSTLKQFRRLVKRHGLKRAWAVYKRAKRMKKAGVFKTTKWQRRRGGGRMRAQTAGRSAEGAKLDDEATVAALAQDDTWEAGAAQDDAQERSKGIKSRKPKKSTALTVEQEKRADSAMKRIAKFALKKAGKAALWVAMTPVRFAAEFAPHALQPKVKAALGMGSSSGGVYGRAKRQVRGRIARKKSSALTEREARKIVESPHPGLRETEGRGLGSRAKDLFMKIATAPGRGFDKAHDAIKRRGKERSKNSDGWSPSGLQHGVEFIH